ncbi:MAG: helix-turn-helix domain-containing protein [Clostridia bacterium]|nr:helix-turn-helix domain-containing protein [Clostridia bacterium]
MDEIGAMLKEEREARGITLEQVSEATKIRTKYLVAIEQGEYDVIAGEVYLKGFIRNYADCIGLDGADLIAQFSESRRAEEKAALRQLERERAGRTERSKRETRDRRSRNVVRVITVLLFAVVIALGLYYAGRALGLFRWRLPWIG